MASILSVIHMEAFSRCDIPDSFETLLKDEGGGQ